MHKASKINRAAAPPRSTPRSTRQTCVWLRPDLCALTHEQWWDERLRTDYSYVCTKSNKKYAQCKHRSRYPDCTARIRQYKLPDGEIVSEQTGEHNHDWETEVYNYGLPQRYKQAIDELLLLNNKFKPAHVVTCMQKKIKTNLSTKETGQVCSYVNRHRSKFRQQHEENTIAGVKSFVNNHPCHEDLEDDCVCVPDIIIQAKKSHVFFLRPEA